MEEGSTTTPFDMASWNKVSRFHIACDLIEQGSKVNPNAAKKKHKKISALKKIIEKHRIYIEKYGDDPEFIKDMRFNNFKY